MKHRIPVFWSFIKRYWVYVQNISDWQFQSNTCAVSQYCITCFIDLIEMRKAVCKRVYFTTNRLWKEIETCWRWKLCLFGQNSQKGFAGTWLLFVCLCVLNVFNVFSYTSVNSVFQWLIFCFIPLLFIFQWVLVLCWYCVTILLTFSTRYLKKI